MDRRRKLSRLPRRDSCLLVARKRFDGDRKRKLLSHKSADKPPAANFAPIFQSTIGNQQFAPARNHGLSCRISRNTTPYRRSNIQQIASSVRLRSWGFTGVQHRPAPRAVPRARDAVPFLARPGACGSTIARILSNPSAVIHPRGHQFPERGFGFRLQHAGAPHDVGKKRCPALAQILQDSRAAARSTPAGRFLHLSIGCGIIHSASSRMKNAIGATLVGSHAPAVFDPSHSAALTDEAKAGPIRRSR